MDRYKGILAYYRSLIKRISFVYKTYIKDEYETITPFKKYFLPNYLSIDWFNDKNTAHKMGSKDAGEDRFLLLDPSWQQRSSAHSSP